MANRPTELHSLGVGVRNPATDNLPGSAPELAEAKSARADRGILETLTWRMFGALPRGWVIAILTIFGWLALVLLGLALWGVLNRG